MLNKERLKQRLYGLEVRATAIIANGLAQGVPKLKILNKVRDELRRTASLLRLSTDEIETLWGSFRRRLDTLYKTTWKNLRVIKDPEERKDAIYSEIRHTVLLQMEKEKNVLANTVEARSKTIELDELMETGIFYLCSSHVKPARDHADWEGKVYVSQDWEARCTDKRTRRRVEAYIKNHDTQTIEWVTGAPVYMCTRPNCKHYFIHVTVEEVLGHSSRSLLRSHKMFMEDKKPMPKEKMAKKAHYERLKAMQYLDGLYGCANLKKDIASERKKPRNGQLVRGRLNKRKDQFNGLAFFLSTLRKCNKR